MKAFIHGFITRPDTRELIPGSSQQSRNLRAKLFVTRLVVKTKDIALNPLSAYARTPSDRYAMIQRPSAEICKCCGVGEVIFQALQSRLLIPSRSTLTSAYFVTLAVLPISFGWGIGIFPYYSYARVGACTLNALSLCFLATCCHLVLMHCHEIFPTIFCRALALFRSGLAISRKRFV
jgi:hypothetical protein